MGESTERWKEVADLFTARLGDVDADQWTAPTPCAEWNVRDLVEHAVGYQAVYLHALGEGEDTVSEFGDDPMGRWVSVRDALAEAYARPEVLDSSFDFLEPIVPGPIAEQIIVPTCDLLIHTWDLARAIGSDESLPMDTCTLALARMREVEHLIRIPEWYGPAIPPPIDADPQQRLLSFVGRAV